MKNLYQDCLDRFKIVIIPAFLFVVCDFLYRLSEMNVVKDAVMSFAFMELGLVVIAALGAFLIALLRRAFPFAGFNAAVDFAVAFGTVVVILMYFKWWLFSLTIADERGLFVIRYYYVVAAALPLAAAWTYLRVRNPWLSEALAVPKRRFTLLVLIVSALSSLILGYGIFSHIRNGEAIPQSPLASRRLNVLLIVVDTLSARSISSYGADNATPVFERLSKESYFFPNARTNLTVTGPSITSILTGRSPTKSHILGYYTVPAEASERNLLTLFEKAGYRTESLVQSKHALTYSLGFPSPTEGEANSFESDWSGRLNRWLSHICRRIGFSLKFRFKTPNKIPDGFSETFVAISERLQRLRERKEPFFFYAHTYLPAHVSDYFYYGGDTDGPAMTVNGRPIKRRERYCNFYPPELQPSIDLARKAYDRGVVELDREFGRFLDSLKKEGILDDTLVVFTADHGESFANGFWGHGNDLSEDSIQVPLYILAPSSEGRVLEQPVQLSDIAPTILHLNGMKIPDWMDGIPALSDSNRRRTAVTFNNISEEPVGTKIVYPGLSSGRSIALYDSGYKYIMHPGGRAGELYDLSRDPRETTNLHDRLPAKTEALQTKLLGLLQSE